MSISTQTPMSRTQKTASLSVLYFVQGLPYGFQDKLIPLLLIVRGHSASAVALTRLLLLPWLAKPLLAPLIDTTLTKAKWVTVSLFSLAVISLLNALVSESESDRTSSISSKLSVTLFVLNLFSAVQDIAVDAIAIAILSSGDEVASGNAAQIVGYKLGAFFGSGILFWIYSSFNWTGLFLALLVVYSSVLVVFVASIGPNLVEADKQWHWLSQTWTQLKPSKTLPSLSRRLLSVRDISPSMASLVCYLLLYKLGESAACTTFPFLLTSSGVSSHQIAFWNGTVAIVCSILGSAMASQLPLSQLPLVIKLRLMPLFMQLWLASLSEWHTGWQHPMLYYLSVISLVSLHFFGGLITTLTFSLMMSTCQNLPESFRATRYTLLSSVEVFGKLVFASLSGFCVDFLGFSGAHLIFWLISILPIFFLAGVPLTRSRLKKEN